MRIVYAVILILILIFTGCIESPLATSYKLAGDNSAELKKVIQHYSNPSDTLKLRAAKFLIENMQHHFTYTGEDVSEYYAKALLLQSVKTYEFWHVIDSLTSNIKTLYIAPDLEHITAEQLIAHIDNIFEYRKYPWCKDLPFDVFAEYVLPYRLVHEPLENWLPLYNVRYYDDFIKHYVRDQLSDSLLCATMTKMHINLSSMEASNYKFDFPPSAYTYLGAATCREYVMLGIYAMRSMGVPVAWDFVPQWATRSMGHDWNVLLLNSREMPFMFGELETFGTHMEDRIGDRAPKVYRRTFSPQKETLKMQSQTTPEEIPAFFDNPHFKDVSTHYFETSDIEVDISVPDELAEKQYAYINVFDNKDWVPVHWGNINKNRTLFTQMNKECMYLATLYDNKTFIPASYPFYINQADSMVYLKPDLNHKIEVNLERKYPDVRMRRFWVDLSRGKFQGANRADFSDAVTLHTIDTVPRINYITVDVNNEKSFSYFRLYIPTPSMINMAEIEVYNTLGEKIEFELIEADKERASYKMLLFDGKVDTHYETDCLPNREVTVGFKKKERIGKIVYLSRNDDNFIKENEIYELFYHNNRWISLGRKRGSKNGEILTYTDVPSNALLLLRNHTKGKEERVFTYDKGEQMWW